MGNRFYIAGIIAILLGMQFRTIDSVVLTQRASTFIEHKLRTAAVRTESPYESLLMTAGPVPKKTIQPPRWLGWALMSAGAVMVLHGLALRREG